jgi:hypothetical protein
VKLACSGREVQVPRRYPHRTRLVHINGPFARAALATARQMSRGGALTVKHYNTIFPLALCHFLLARWVVPVEDRRT